MLSSFTYLLRIALLAILFGSGPLWVKLGLTSLSPVQVALVQLIVAAFTLHALRLLRRESLVGLGRIWRQLLMMSVLANVLPSLLVAWSLQATPSAVVGILNASTPLFVFALGWPLRTDRSSITTVLLLLVGFLGVIVVLAPQLQPGRTYSIAALLAALAAAASYGLAYVYAEKFVHLTTLSPNALAATQLSFGSGIISFMYLLTSRQSWHLETTSIAALLILGVGSTGLAYSYNYRLILLRGAGSTSLMAFMVPLVAASLGYTVLHEPVGLSLLIGGVLIVGSIALVTAQGTRNCSE